MNPGSSSTGTGTTPSVFGTGLGPTGSGTGLGDTSDAATKAADFIILATSLVAGALLG